MSGPSERAAKRGFEAFDRMGTFADGLNAAHDPALGLDRSVCLRDVVEAIAEWEALAAEGNALTVDSGAKYVERVFGGGS